jgi:hypothetical protein
MSFLAWEWTVVGVLAVIAVAIWLAARSRPRPGECGRVPRATDLRETQIMAEKKPRRAMRDPSVIERLRRRRQRARCRRERHDLQLDGELHAICTRCGVVLDLRVLAALWVEASLAISVMLPRIGLRIDPRDFLERL